MTTNPENYIGATLTLVGWTSKEAERPAYDKDGSRGVLELSIPINEGYKKDGEFKKTGTTWYTYSAAGDYADALSAIPKGSKVRIEDAKQEVREYEANGVKKMGIGLRFGKVIVLEAGKGGGQTSSAAPDSDEF